MEKKIIFYSWQSDLPNAGNRGLIEGALGKAIQDIQREQLMEVEPVVDRDVQGRGGSPDISRVIFEKIDRAAIFVADVSIINTNGNDRKMPNPNVLVELGYAIKALSHDRVILIMNTEFGGPELLPFDLKMRYAITYSTANAADRSNQKKILQSKLAAQLKMILQSLPKETPLELPQEVVKKLLVDQQGYIRLSDYLTIETRKFSAKLDRDHFPVDRIKPTSEGVIERIQQYDQLVDNFVPHVLLIAQWATQAQIKLLERIVTTLAETRTVISGDEVWIKLEWYPILKLMYAIGVTTVAFGRYDVLSALLQLRMTENLRGKVKSITKVSFEHLASLREEFENLPGRKNNYVPMSQHLFVQLKVLFNEIFQSDESYEKYFDRFEVLMALECANSDGGWGPTGRFGYKHFGGHDSPYQSIIEEAKIEGENWTPLKNGMFNGSKERFLEVEGSFREMLEGRAERYL